MYSLDWSLAGHTLDFWYTSKIQGVVIWLSDKLLNAIIFGMCTGQCYKVDPIIIVMIMTAGWKQNGSLYLARNKDRLTVLRRQLARAK